MNTLFCSQWDVGIQTMSKGEKAEFVIEPEWAYGKKGVEGRYPLLIKLQVIKKIKLNNFLPVYKTIF